MPDLPVEETWLPLKQAAERLSVHPTTLRRWADSGAIRVMVTPGGHRRFAESELVRFAQARGGLRSETAYQEKLASEALSTTRSEIATQQDARWLTKLDDAARARNREMGRRLMGLLMQFIADEDEENHLLLEAQGIAAEYAALARDAGISLPEALKATMFFRDNIVETAIHLPETERLRPKANRRLLRRLNLFLNAVQLAIAEGYEAPAA